MELLEKVELECSVKDMLFLYKQGREGTVNLEAKSILRKKVISDVVPVLVKWEWY